MSTKIILERLALYSMLIGSIVMASSGCAKIRDLTEDKAYLTPVPQATLDAFRFGQPVRTKLQAVIAAQAGIRTTRMEWVGQPAAILAEEMDYEEAVRRASQPGVESYHSTPLDARVWLVVFEGEWRITTPLGTTTPPFHGCAYAVVDAKGGSGMIAGGFSCEKLR